MCPFLGSLRLYALQRHSCGVAKFIAGQLDALGERQDICTATLVGPSCTALYWKAEGERAARVMRCTAHRLREEWTDARVLRYLVMEYAVFYQGMPRVKTVILASLDTSKRKRIAKAIKPGSIVLPAGRSIVIQSSGFDILRAWRMRCLNASMSFSLQSSSLSLSRISDVYDSEADGGESRTLVVLTCMCARDRSPACSAKSNYNLHEPKSRPGPGLIFECRGALHFIYSPPGAISSFCLQLSAASCLLARPQAMHVHCIPTRPTGV